MKSGEGRRRLRADDDRGMTAVEFVILTPVIFMILMVMVQFAVYLFAKQAANAAVRSGGRVAREEAATRGCLGAGYQDGAGASGAMWQADATTEALTRATAIGGQLLTGVKVTTSATPGGTAGVKCPVSSVSVHLTATVPSIVPGMTMTVSVGNSGPLEQFVPHP